MHWIFGSQKYIPHHPAVSRFPLSAVITAPCDALSFCSVTAHAHRKRVRSNNAPTRNVTLVYLFLFAVELLCCDMLWYSCEISSTDLLTVTDEICLLDVSLHRIIISIHFPLIYAIWWALLRDHISVWMDDRDTRFPLAHTHTHWSARDVSMRTQTTSPELRVWASLHECFIWVEISSYHIPTEM